MAPCNYFMLWTRPALQDAVNKTNKTADNSQHITTDVLPPSWNAFLSHSTRVEEPSRCLSGRRTGNLRSGTQTNKLDGDYSTPSGPLRGSCWVNAPLWLWTWSEASQAWIDGAGRVHGSDFSRALKTRDNNMAVCCPSCAGQTDPG